MSGLYWAAEGSDPNDPEAWEKLEGVEPTGFSLGPVSVPDESKAIENYTADMRFTRVYGRGWGKTAMQKRMAEEWMERYGMQLQEWQRPYVRGILGRFDYTPADELRDRLNDGLKGKEPRPAINTRYWRNL